MGICHRLALERLLELGHDWAENPIDLRCCQPLSAKLHCGPNWSQPQVSKPLSIVRHLGYSSSAGESAGRHMSSVVDILTGSAAALSCG